MRQSISSPQRKMLSLNLILTGTGTAALSGPDARNCSLVDNNTGDYTLTFDVPFAATPVVQLTSATADSIALIGTLTASSVQIRGFDATDGTTAKDIVVHVSIIGSEVADTYDI